MKSFVIFFFCVLGFMASAQADWRSVGSMKAAADEKSFSVQQPISRIVVVCTQGNVVIEKLTVIHRGGQTPYQMNSQLAKGESQRITVGEQVDCDQIKVIVSGQGEYELKVRP